MSNFHDYHVESEVVVVEFPFCNIPLGNFSYLLLLSEIDRVFSSAVSRACSCFYFAERYQLSLSCDDVDFSAVISEISFDDFKPVAFQEFRCKLFSPFVPKTLFSIRFSKRYRETPAMDRRKSMFSNCLQMFCGQIAFVPFKKIIRKFLCISVHQLVARSLCKD